jgi:hypothetical protein
MFIDVTTHADQKPRINVNLITAIIDHQVHFSGGLVLDLDDESMKAVLLATEPKEKQTKSDKVNKELEDLFTQLHKLTGGKGKPVFSLQREKKLNDLLTKHRMTKEQLIKAATNIGKDDFLQGQNDSNKRYGDVDYLLRPDKAAKWAEDQTEKKKSMF